MKILFIIYVYMCYVSLIGPTYDLHISELINEFISDPKMYGICN